MRTARYSIHGLEVVSEVPLSAQLSSCTGPIDLSVRLERHETACAPAGPVVAGAGGYEIRKSANGFDLSFAGTVDFFVTANSISVHPAIGANHELISLLLSGNALALALVARGELVLHASAVEVERTAVVFVGSSGMGKSTFAGLLCAAGHAVITDDVFRVSVLKGNPTGYWGSPELRLRPGAAAIRDILRGWESRESCDGRLVLRNRSQLAGECMPIRSIIFPNVTDESPQALSLIPVHGANALFELIRHPRLLGWRDADVLAFTTNKLGELARSVPMYQCSLPRGTPLDAGLSHRLSKLVVGQ